MAQAVEARSLSRLNALAANPPQYPVNPTEQRQEPLILYISRVPGSRDVIFSPFKPQLKNVTGEDVANSLYYIHLDTPSDFDLQEAPGTATSNESHRPSLETSSTSRGASSAPRSPIARKPLPASAKALSIKSIPATTPPPTAVISRDREPDSPSSAKKAPVIVNSNETSPVDKHMPEPKNEISETPEKPPPVPLKDVSPIEKSPTQQVPITRKPLGPRALSTQSTRSVNEGAGGFLQPNNNTDVRPNSSASAAHSLAEHQRNTHTSEGPTIQPPRSPRSPSPKKGPRDMVPFTLTVIRRDPSTGNQWNVGKVSSYQLLNPTVPTLDPEAPPSYAELAGLVPTNTTAAALAVPPNISIRVETSGYAKFRGNFPTRDSIDVNRRQRATSAASSITGASTDSLSILRGSGAVTGEDFFTRQLIMSYQKSWTSNIREAWKNRNRSNSSSPPKPEPEPPLSPLEPPPVLPFHGRARSDSGGSVESFSSPNGSPTKSSFSLQALRQNQKSNGHGNGEQDPRQLITAPGPGLKPRGYAFASPWDGICEFRTSSSGRGVKCVHSLPGGPLHAEGGTPVGTTVSELRFNLPSADMFREKGQELQGKLDRLKVDGQHRLQEQWNKGHRRAQSSVDSNTYSHNGDDHDDMGLSLGRERAGGGNRGKRAKLGKLIVYDEGLKMLDLVVAANVGVWWGAWERSF
ncbi:hypothetical protein MGG_03481 [Pyricularia oryzae 70-15]|uniref:Oxidoreductase-like protein n=3 Tax=Pyricularia oryzae TaxID=318829 RepID=G4N821_PYRO7|nr:uncharacterized protein MGG_03481 [Pyricularia oryzae 70-15]EHA50123.1 hypothetical protein MGG_03481 [Pyricularia oryzae 70-15]ELQ40346.1 hypothetical protein OOU_Y34scaffold00448g46 [Pyricularia oryzae Y34]KAI7927331.1 hypothetical protein M9X92_002312 [Pyricularia oryzae]KAI7927837.1 hypothetical protein M0657_002956 [Pyricularia oryzae]